MKKMGQQDTSNDKLISWKFSLERTKEMLDRSLARWKGKKVPSIIKEERRGMRERIKHFKSLISNKEDN